MRRTLGLALAIGLLAAGPMYSQQLTPPATQAAGAGASAATGTAAISGVVSDAITGKPIAGASVLFSSIGANGQRLAPRPSMLTDARGRFVFTDLSSTPRYSLIASRPGYTAATYAHLIKLGDGEWMRDANIKLWRLGSITGRVVDERGEAVIGAPVRLFVRRLLAGHEQLAQGAVVTTDDRGVYRFSSLQPDSYIIAVLSVQATVPAATADGPRRLPLGGLEGRGGVYAPPGPAPEARGASIDVDGRHRLVLTNFPTPPPAEDRTRAYAPVFYPGGRTVADAQTVELEMGKSREGIDFQLVPVITSRVSGRLTGKVVNAANMLLRLMAPGTESLGFGSEVATTLVEPDGAFTFLNVPAGNYTIIASSGIPETSSGGSSQGSLSKSVGYFNPLGFSAMYPTGASFMWWESPAGASVWGRLPVTVGAGDATGLDVALHSTSSVSGHIVFEGSPQPAPGERFSIGLEPANADPTLGAPNDFTEANDPSHGFEINGLRGGRYFVRIMPYLAGWRVSSVTANGVDITDAGFDGSLGSNYDNVVVTVAKTGAQISGVLRDARGQPAPGAVMLFPVDSKLWVDYGLTPDRLASGGAGSDGVYKLTNLRDGEYFVIAVPSNQSSGWQDPKFLAAAVPLATRVSLSNAATKSQDLRVSEVTVK